MDTVDGKPERVKVTLFARSSALEVRDIIKADISRHIVLRDLARKATTNECTLKKEFKNLFKITVYQYLLQCRMLHANNLLRTTPIKIKDIAMECGYESPAAFINSFKRYYGVSPGGLRRKRCSAA